MDITIKGDEPVGYTVKGLIDKAGGIGVVAQACGVSYQTVDKWNRRIPGVHAATVAILCGLPLGVVRPDHVKGVAEDA